MTVSTVVSDLWFNLDHGDHKICDENDQFVDWDEAKMRETADWFLCCILALSGRAPTVDDLLADFFARI